MSLKNKGNYIDGRTLKQYYCLCGNKINYYTFRKGTNQCRKCYLNSVIQKYYCIDCGKQLSRKGCLRCYSCNVKGNRNYMYHRPGYFLGKKFTQEHRINLSLSKKGKILGKNNPNWQGGKSFEPYIIEFNQKLKEQIRKRDNYICQKCNLSEKQHQLKYHQVLHVHHIDYDKQNCNKNNLISLCNNCNTKVNKDRDYWFAYFTYILENK